ncbi:MAG TPA: hypothetical protein VLM85_16855, partial [Polyangiaceae bacterium]|nr:hypothetical protein [Polyangiaceae bacterium]
MRGPAISLGLGATGAACVLCLVASCGARTGLLAPEPEDARPDKPTHHDAQPDLFVEEDALPLIDTFLPDVPVFTDCPDAGSTLVYLITEENALLSFYPPTLGFKTIGK